MKLILFILLSLPAALTAQVTIRVSGGSTSGGGVSQGALDDTASAIRTAIASSNPITIKRAIQRLNNDAFSSANTVYNGWFTSWTLGTKQAVIVREGNIHTYDGSSPVYMVQYLTTDGWHHWTKDTIHFESLYDVRNYGGGVTPNGTIMIFFARYKGPSNGGFISNRYLRSTDGGVTWTESSDLAMASVTHEFSPYGPMQVAENGDLVQSFYGDIGTGGSAVPKVYTLRSTDDGVTWGSAVTIKQGLAGESLLYNETSIVHLANGNWMAAIRKETTLNKLCIIYNSDDDALTWDSIGVLAWGNSDFPGVSPLLIRKNDSVAYAVGVWRASANALHIQEVKFGTHTALTPPRIGPQLNNVGAFGIDCGYPTPLIPPGSTNEDDWLLSIYDSSPRVNGVDEGTDVMIVPFNFNRYTRLVGLASNNISSATNSYITAQGITIDELAMNNLDADRSFYHVRKDGIYNIQFNHTLTTTNATGTFRRVVFERWNKNDNVLMEQIFEETHYVANTGYEVFKFNFTIDLRAGESVRCFFRHDATGTVATGTTAPEIKITKISE